MALSDIVNVSITSQTVAPTKTGFGIPLVTGYHTVFSERARIYTSTTAMLADGFSSSAPIYKAVQAIFSQNPRPIKVIVGRNLNDDVQTIRITPIAQDSMAYTVVLNGKTATYTSDATATIAEITAGLKTAIDALSENVTTTDNTTSLDIAANTADDAFSFYVGDRALLTQDNTTVDDGGSDGIADDLAEISLVNNDWYCLILANPGKAVVAAASAYIESLKKIMIVASADDAIYDSGSTTDLAYVASIANYARTITMYHPRALDQFPGAAYAGKMLPKIPGSATWKFKSLAGVDSVILTETEITNIEAKECNHYVEVAGIPITQQGISASGEFIDITRSSDWLVARIQENVFARFAQQDKVPFTNPGAAVVQSEVTGVLQTGINNEMLASDPAPIVTVPDVGDVSVTDKANRHLPDVRFSATWAGAIHSTTISGVVSV